MNRSIQFPSITYAQKALKILEENGVKSRLSRRGARGCGYLISVAGQDLETALSALRRASIPHSV